MTRPVIGVIANAHTIGDDYHIQGATAPLIATATGLCCR